MNPGYIAQKEQANRIEDLLLYRGTNNRPLKAYLIFKNQETTLCNRIEADRIKKGKSTETKPINSKDWTVFWENSAKTAKKSVRKRSKNEESHPRGYFHYLHNILCHHRGSISNWMHFRPHQNYLGKVRI